MNQLVRIAVATLLLAGCAATARSSASREVVASAAIDGEPGGASSGGAIALRPMPERYAVDSSGSRDDTAPTAPSRGAAANGP